MREREPWFESLRGRRNQDFDGEAHLTNEELDALLAVAEAAQRLIEGRDEFDEFERRLYNALVGAPDEGRALSSQKEPSDA